MATGASFAAASSVAAYIDRHNWSVHSGSAHPGAGSVEGSVRGLGASVHGGLARVVGGSLTRGRARASSADGGHAGAKSQHEVTSPGATSNGYKSVYATLTGDGSHASGLTAPDARLAASASDRPGQRIGSTAWREFFYSDNASQMPVTPASRQTPLTDGHKFQHHGGNIIVPSNSDAEPDQLASGTDAPRQTAVQRHAGVKEDALRISRSFGALTTVESAQELAQTEERQQGSAAIESVL